MRWATYVSPTDQTARPGVLHNGAIHGLRGTERLIDLLGDDGGTLAEAGQRAVADPLEVVAEGDAVLRAPVPAPPSVRDFFAFEEHVVTSNRALGGDIDPEWYDLPVFYFSNPAAIIGPRDAVRISPGSEQFDYELEIGAVIGRGGSDLRPDEAEAHIAGYTIFCDWSARDLQAREMRQNLGPVKGKDTATSIGPYLVTPDELEPARGGNAYNLRMTATVNGKPYSAGTFADIYWTYGQLLAYASRGTRLVPGDVIGSGTVGTGCILELSRVHGLAAYPWLRPGDRVKLEVEQLGSMEAELQPSIPVIPLR
ncbi:MAG TPA: fumarylacetoacetate hydrolase family protein [Mycobacteriales bacterium]|jgi:2-keto-4-pentenoate hydratase/2-oxohepta-3-ene-1,7-dioic acid hydratase in catechol pathway|nr:fumarylacetoacetate hydrolase family protein [Mycobacteriales bacterium]